MPTAVQIRTEITAQIVAALERGVVPWRRPWTLDRASGRHANATSGDAYSGINPIILELHALHFGFASRFWGTFQQWKKLGCQVKQRPEHVETGRWAAQIIFYKPFKKTVVDDETGDEDERQFRVMRTFSLFNADQVEGDAVARFQVSQQPTEEVTADFVSAEELIAATGAMIEHGGNAAFYARPQPAGAWPHHTSGDYVRLPHRGQFPILGAYYETAFHELAHWSEPRLDFDEKHRDYAACELIAEMAACFLATELGLPQGEPLENHAAYLKSWLVSMKGDTSFVFRAATQATKTADYLMSFVRPVGQPEPEVVGHAD